MQSTLFQILPCLGVAMELLLIEDGNLLGHRRRIGWSGLVLLVSGLCQGHWEDIGLPERGHVVRGEMADPEAMRTRRSRRSVRWRRSQASHLFERDFWPEIIQAECRTVLRRFLT